MTIQERLSGEFSDLLVISNARIVLSDRTIMGNVSISDGKISAIDEGRAPGSAIDIDGDYLIPGLVDIHTDHFEKHVYPRAHVRWDPLQAALAHDAQIIGSGITTVFDSLCVGATESNPDRKHTLEPMIEAIETGEAAGLFRAEHFIHLRCELTDEDTPRLAGDHMGRDIVRLASVMEHIPGQRQTQNLAKYIDAVMTSTGQSEEEVRRRTREIIERCAGVTGRTRPDIVMLAHKHGLPLLSHDDTAPEHIDLAVSEGIGISEFPCSLEAARLAQENRMLVVGGAPNIMRGGSQSGNVAVADLMAEDLVDVLASDYVPRAMLDAAFLIAADNRFDFSLPDAIRLVTKNPADLAGLGDRGEIAPGRRADLVHVAVYEGTPCVKQIWRQGRRVF